jgi:hypothetical protein
MTKIWKKEKKEKEKSLLRWAVEKCVCAGKGSYALLYGALWKLKRVFG